MQSNTSMTLWGNRKIFSSAILVSSSSFTQVHTATGPNASALSACTEVIYFLLYIHFISSVQRSKRCYVKSVSFIAHKHHFSVSTAAFIGPVFTITNKRLDLAHARLSYCWAGKAPHVLAACFPWIMVPGLQNL